jgi:6-phosphofructokinase 1
MPLSDVRTIGILTGGGDCPGINPAIKAVVCKARSVGVRVLGIRDGWRGLLTDDPADVVELDCRAVEAIDRTGGTILGTSRTNPYRRVDGPGRVASRILALGLDAVVVVGGEDTLGVADRLVRDHGLRIVGIPKTIDRDLSLTDYTLGFESAVQTIAEAIDHLRTTAAAHGRIFVLETMGRLTGHLALRGGIAGGADLVLIPEVEFEVERVCDLLRDRRSQGFRYSIVVVAEGASATGGAKALRSLKTDEFGHKLLGGIGQDLSNEIESRTGLDARYVILSHLQRGGAPGAYDRRMAYYFGTAAVEAVLSGRPGTMVALSGTRVELVSLADAVREVRPVDVARDYDPLNFRHQHRVLGDDLL